MAIRRRNERPGTGCAGIRWAKPHGQGKNGAKGHVLVDARGIPLSIVVTGANVHDSKGIGRLLDAKVVVQVGVVTVTENLCLDARHTGKADIVAAKGYVPHIRPLGEEAAEIKRNPDFKARRWAVEASLSWMNRFRKLVPRHEKTDLSYCGFLDLAAGMIVLNKVAIIYG